MEQQGHAFQELLQLKFAMEKITIATARLTKEMCASNAAMELSKVTNNASLQMLSSQPVHMEPHTCRISAPQIAHLQTTIAKTITQDAPQTLSATRQYQELEIATARAGLILLLFAEME